MKKILTVFLSLLLFVSLTVTPIYAAKKYSGKYHIMVNRAANCITVYELNSSGKYKPVKAMLCSTGGYKSPLGTFYTPVKYRWRSLFYNCYGQYATRITGNILFHSMPYDKPRPDTMQKGHFNRLGTAASSGCIRLCVTDAKWIYENCPLGTKVTIYDSEVPGPLGKPENVPYPVENGYDPTDIWAEGNPATSSLKPEIEISEILEIDSSDCAFDLLDGVTAVSSTGEDITDRIEITEDIDYNTPGEYEIIYSVTDDYGKTASVKGKVIVN